MELWFKDAESVMKDVSATISKKHSCKATMFQDAILCLRARNKNDEAEPDGQFQEH